MVGPDVSCATHVLGDRQRLRIKVTDTGLGIPPESVERLFVPFERVGSEHSAIEGTGLGLPLAEAMGGTLDLASTPSRAAPSGSSCRWSRARSSGTSAAGRPSPAPRSRQSTPGRP